MYIHVLLPGSRKDMYIACMDVLIYHSIICVRVDRHACLLLIQKCDVFCSFSCFLDSIKEYVEKTAYAGT
jgi:hypothetical protein